MENDRRIRLLKLIQDNREKPVRPGWFLVEAHDGEYPVLREYRDMKSLAERINKLEKQEVVVLPFYGIPLNISRQKPRIVWSEELPWAASAHDKVIPTKSLPKDLEKQEDGYLGT